MITRYTQPSPEQWDTITARPTASFADLAPKVQAIFERIKNEGDAALRDFTRAFDKVLIDELAVSPADIAAAEAQLTEPLKAAITLAYTNIEKFHAAQQTAPHRGRYPSGGALLAGKTTHRTGRAVYPRRNGPFVFHPIDAGHPC